MGGKSQGVKKKKTKRGVGVKPVWFARPGGRITAEEKEATTDGNRQQGQGANRPNSEKPKKGKGRPNPPSKAKGYCPRKEKRKKV